MRRLHLFAILLFLGSIAGPRHAIAAYQFTNISQTPGISIQGSLAHSGGPASIVAWEEGPGTVHSRLLAADVWQDPIEHGSGTRPVLAWGRAGAILAYASGNDVIVREGNGSSWSEPIHMSGSEAVLSLDLHCAKEPASDLAYLVWETVPRKLYFATRTTTGWSAPAMVYQPTDGYGPMEPQVSMTRSGTALVPRIYFLIPPRLKYIQREGASWGAPVLISSLQTAGTDFEVAAGPDLRHFILSLGPQPT